MVTPEQAQQALAQDSAGAGARPITAILVDLGVSEGALVGTLAAAAGIDFVDLTDVQIDASAVTMVPEAMCRRLGCLPITFDGTTLVVAISDPTNVLAKDDLRAVTRSEISVVLATASDIDAAINRFHRMDESFDSLTGEFGGGNVVDTVEDISSGTAQPRDVRTLTLELGVAR